MYEGWRHGTAAQESRQREHGRHSRRSCHHVVPRHRAAPHPALPLCMRRPHSTAPAGRLQQRRRRLRQRRRPPKLSSSSLWASGWTRPRLAWMPSAALWPTPRGRHRQQQGQQQQGTGQPLHQQRWQGRRRRAQRREQQHCSRWRHRPELRLLRCSNIKRNRKGSQAGLMGSQQLHSSKGRQREGRPFKGSPTRGPLSERMQPSPSRPTYWMLPLHSRDLQWQASTTGAEQAHKCDAIRSSCPSGGLRTPYLGRESEGALTAVAQTMANWMLYRCWSSWSLQVAQGSGISKLAACALRVPPLPPPQRAAVLRPTAPACYNVDTTSVTKPWMASL